MNAEWLREKAEGFVKAVLREAKDAPDADVDMLQAIADALAKAGRDDTANALVATLDAIEEGRS